MIQGLDEETFQELFQELKREDKLTTTGFEGVWQASVARVGDARRKPPLFPLAVTFLVLLVTCASLLFYFQQVLKQSTPHAPSSQPSQDLASQGNYLPSSIGRFGEQQKDPARGGPPSHLSVQSISEWRSPTAFLLRPPSDSLLTGVPDLTRSLIRIDLFKTVTFN